jgi:hypothetical protein
MKLLFNANVPNPLLTGLTYFGLPGQYLLRLYHLHIGFASLNIRTFPCIIVNQPQQFHFMEFSRFLRRFLSSLLTGVSTGIALGAFLVEKKGWSDGSLQVLVGLLLFIAAILGGLELKRKRP